MKASTKSVYLTITAVTTLATALIWGINTIFLLDAGLSNAEAFGANAFYMLAQVLFEVPTGVVADTKGRARSFMYGTVVLSGATLLYGLLYVWHAGFVWWAIASALLGLGFTFFSGATEAWLVDALNDEGRGKDLPSVLAAGQAIGGGVMLVGATLGGWLAQQFGFLVPYIARAGLLVVAFIVAWLLMRDKGFTPEKDKHWLPYTKQVLRSTGRQLRALPDVRYLMISGALTMGVFGYAFYALQPYLLELSKGSGGLILAGASASLMALAQMFGGIVGARFSTLFRSPKQALVIGVLTNVTLLIAVGLIHNLLIVLGLFFVWSMTFALVMPQRQALLNSLLPSKERATFLSVDSLGGSLTGSALNPMLGRVADVYSYGTSFVIGGITTIASLPFVGKVQSVK